MEMFKKIVVLPLLLLVILMSCSSGDTGGNSIPVNPPSTVVLNAEIVGATAQLPNGNGTGVVNFSITSDAAAISYKISFGDDTTLDTKAKVFSHTYTSSGTKAFTVQVSAFDGLKYYSATKSIVVFIAVTKIWGDEFDVDGAPNSNNWGYDIGAGGWGNNEEQYYTNRPENVIVQNGVLKIRTIKETYSGSPYTSARILTKDKFSFKYGKVEFRAKLPVGAGTWPALWMLGSDINTVGWPACGEIDVMEHVYNQLNKIFATLHYPGHFGGNGTGSSRNISNATTEFHIYSIDWRSDFIKIYVDNVEYFSFANSNAVPFNHDFFIIINSAIGGGFGGAIDTNFVSSTFEVDYVRVYN